MARRLAAVVFLAASAASALDLHLDAAGKAGESGAIGRGRTSLWSEPEEILEKTVQEKVDEFKRSYERTRGKVRNFRSLPRRISEVWDRVWSTFLPHWRFPLIGFLKAYGTVCIGVLWFWLYFAYCYTDDRNESMARWEKKLQEARAQMADKRGFFADVVLVFQHPNIKNRDGDHEVSFKTLDNIVVEEPELIDAGFTRLASLLQLARSRKRSTMDHVREHMERVRRFTATGASPGRATAEDLHTDNVRKALLQDIYAALPQWGFDVSSFASVDKDEIFVTVTLKRTSSIEYFVTRDNIDLQLREKVVQQLGIKQDPNVAASSPAYILPNQRIASSLKESGIISSLDGREMFRTFHRPDREEILSSMECIRVVYRELASYVDLGAAKENGLLLESYPVHDPLTVAELQAIWANWWALLDISFIQPVNYIRQYFGGRVAFLFAWNGVYCKALLALVAVAFIQSVVIGFLRNVLAIEIFKFRQVIGFSIVVMVWSRIALNIWEREQNFYLELWNMYAIETEGIVRPRFHGSNVPSLVDENVQEKRYPPHLAAMRRAISSTLTIFFCMFVAACIFCWMLAFEGKMGLFSSIMLSVQIKVFGFIFTYLVEMLTEYENHKYQEDYHNSLLWKLFLFEFINNYSAFFFLTVRNAWYNVDCPSVDLQHDCLPVLQSQLALVLCILSACSIAQVLAYSFLVKVKLWHESWSYRRTHGEDLQDRTAVEEQSKYAKIEETQEVQNMTTLAIALGYVLLFGGVSSKVVPLAFGVFCVQLRAFAVLLTTYGQRTFPQRSRGIGHWQGVVRVLMSLGVVYSGFLFVAYGQAFKDAELLAKMTGFFVYCALSFMVWGIIDIIFPSVDSDTILLAQRRKYVVHKLMKLVEAADHKRLTAPQARGSGADSSDPIVRGAWDEVETLHALATPRSSNKV